METLKAEIRRQFPSFHLSVGLEVKAGIHVLFGASGVGKTLTLECLAGLNRPDQGLIQLGGEIWFRRKAGFSSIDVPPNRRSIGYLVQDGALFPHRTILQNVMYPLRVRGERSSDRAMKLLREMGMGSFAERYPDQVSGGQRRRAAIARALAVNPKVLLLDEPFVHLDRVVRSKLMADLRRLVEDTQIPTLLVTHDLDVAARIADEISVMEDGSVVQAGSKHEVLFTPATAGVVRLFGNANILNGKVTEVSGGLWHIETEGIVWKIPYIGDLETGQRVEVVIRSGAVKILKPEMPVPEALAVNSMKGRLVEMDRRFETVSAGFALTNGIVLTGSIPTDVFDRSGLRTGDHCDIGVNLDGILLFPDVEEP